MLIQFGTLFAAFLYAIGYELLFRTYPNIGEPVEWWAPGEPKPMDEKIYGFELNIPTEVIEDLYKRIFNTHEKYHSLEGAPPQVYGADEDLVNYIKNYWITKYNWEERLKFILQFPQYKTNIRGLDIHFLHVVPTKVPSHVKVLPLLMIHGWPSSIIEFYGIIPSLTSVTKSRNFTFEIIAPSLPGFGFSDPATRFGMNPAEIAHIFKDLMFRLGHERFFVHGGDMGSMIARDMAIIYPEAILGLHRSWCPALNMFEHWKVIYGSLMKSVFFTDTEIKAIYPRKSAIRKVFRATGSFHQLSIRPDTIGIALTDSPLGLAAYIIDHFLNRTYPQYKLSKNGELKTSYDMNQIFDNIMIYWITSSITTSMRIFAEYSIPGYEEMLTDKAYVTVPTACNRFESDIFFPPETILREQYPKLIHLTTFFNGGHYPAFELPKTVSQDIFEFVNKVALSEPVYRDL